MADQDARADRQEERAIGTAADNKAWREDQRDFNRDQVAIGNQRYKEEKATSDKRYEQTQAISAERYTEQQATQQQRLDLNKKRTSSSLQVNEQRIRNLKKEDLLKKGIGAGQVMLEGGAPMSLEMHEELESEGLGHVSPYNLMKPEKRQILLKGEKILAEMGKGNLAYVNSPESLSTLNAIYGDQINHGVGEIHPIYNSKVVKKELAEIEAAKGERVILKIRTYLEDGQVYEAPRTINNSTQAGDPVELKDAGMLFDDLGGRVQLAKIAETPDFQNRVGPAWKKINGIKEARSKLLSPEGKLYADQVALGLSPEESRERAFSKEDERAKFIGKYILEKTKNSGFSQQAVDPKAWVDEASKLYDEMSGDKPESDPQKEWAAAIERNPNITKALQVLKNNPQNKQRSDQELIQALLSKSK